MLDAGCGLGRHSLLAFRDYPVRVIGLDLSFPDLVETRNRLEDIRQNKCKGEICLTQGSGFQLPFADHSFNVVICSEVLEHVPNYEVFISELVRVLEPGGTLAISVPKYFPERVCWLLSRKYPEHAGHIRIFRGSELPNAVRKEGLSLSQKHSAHALHSPYWWLRSFHFKRGEDFLPVRSYKKLMDWQLVHGPDWTNSLESFFNPVLGKSNVYYFTKP